MGLFMRLPLKGAGDWTDCPNTPLLTNLRFVSQHPFGMSGLLPPLTPLKGVSGGEDLSVKGGSQYQGEDLSVSGCKEMSGQGCSQPCPPRGETKVLLSKQTKDHH